jgi:hypothetical protein
MQATKQSGTSVPLRAAQTTEQHINMAMARFEWANMKTSLPPLNPKRSLA